METQQILEFILQLGVAGIGFAFFWVERRDHMATIDKHRDELRGLREFHINDLREIAGLRQNLGRVQTFVSDAKQVQPASEMMHFP